MAAAEPAKAHAAQRGRMTVSPISSHNPNTPTVIQIGYPCVTVITAGTVRKAAGTA